MTLPSSKGQNENLTKENLESISQVTRPRFYIKLVCKLEDIFIYSIVASLDELIFLNIFSAE